MKRQKKKSTMFIGGDSDDFEIEIVTVKIYQTRRERIVNTLWTVTATITAVTVAQVYIIPILMS